MHTMRLKDKYYNYILNGTKRIELRLNDEKRKLIKVNDTIRFFKDSNLDEYFDAKVIELLQYESFEQILNDFDISILADKSTTKEELKNILEQFYSKEEQEKYGVLGIKIELIKER